MKIPHQMNIARVDPYQAASMIYADARVIMAKAIAKGWVHFNRNKTPTKIPDKGFATAEQRAHYRAAAERRNVGRH